MEIEKKIVPFNNWQFKTSAYNVYFHAFLGVKSLLIWFYLV